MIITELLRKFARDSEYLLYNILYESGDLLDLINELRVLFDNNIRTIINCFHIKTKFGIW